MTNDRSLNSGGSCWSFRTAEFLCFQTGVQSDTRAPTQYNICLNLTQALLITCPAWARQRQHRDLCCRGLCTNCVTVWTQRRNIAVTARRSNGTAASNTLRHCVQIKQIYGPHYPLSYETQPWRMLISNSINNRNTYHIGMQASARSDALFVHKSQGRISSLCVREPLSCSCNRENTFIQQPKRVQRQIFRHS